MWKCSSSVPRYHSGSGWGHRHFSLAALNNNAGSADSEGLLGFGTFQGSGGSYEVMNVADEKATWDYTTADNIYLWSEMVGGGNNVGNPPKNGGAGGAGGSPLPLTRSPRVFCSRARARCTCGERFETDRIEKARQLWYE